MYKTYQTLGELVDNAIIPKYNYLIDLYDLVAK